jgi:hypothetical protein
MPSNFEEILLAIERERFPLDALTRRIAALEQSLMASWMYAGGAPPPPVVQENCVDAFATGGVDCPCIPTVMPFLITTMGFGTLTWNGSSPSDTSGYWAGCLIWNRPGSTGCTARAIPVFVSLFPSLISPECTFRIGWIDTSGACPDSGKACTDVAQVTQTAERTDASTDCSDGTFKIGTPTGGSDLIVTQSDLTGFGGGSLFYYANAGNYAPCPKTWLPASVPFVDSLYGSGTLVYNTTGKWTACLAGLSYPAFGTCTAKTIAIHYELTHDGGLKVHCNATGVCPNTSTCTTASGASNFVVAAPTVTPECAAGAVASYAVPTAAGTFGRSLYRGTASTISITLP